MPLLSQYAQTKKIEYFLEGIPKQARILEIGSGSGWVGNYLKQNGYKNYVGMDLEPPADVVGDIRDWRSLGLEEQSFDAIVAFEVVEHVDCFKECFDLLKPGGKLMLTSPVPDMDWAMQLLELVGLNQKRTSPHDHLVYFEDVPYFQDKDIRIVGFLSQWGIFTKFEDRAKSIVNSRA
jgi:cyclopropane fatty-acyl-phospholipid synthase-like methyltransferase